MAPRFGSAQSVSTSGAAPPPVVYQEPLEDLRVKVLGGHIVIQRTFAENKWHPNYNWAPLRLTFDNIDGSVKSIARGSFEYTKSAPGVFTEGKRNTITQTATGFRWSDRSGNWIEYNASGQIQRYGDRNNVAVSFQYETAGEAQRISGIRDHLDRQVIWYEYTNDRLSAIRDHTDRRVQYQYTNGNLTSVIDVNGHTWTYGYTGTLPTTFTDPEGRTITRTWAGNGALASLRYADGVGTDYKHEYDSSKSIFYTQEKTTGGRTIETWTNEDREVIRKDINGKTVQTQTADSAARSRAETDPRGLKTIREYDQWDNVTKITYPDGATVSTTYDPVFSNPTQTIDERGVMTRYEYDTRGNLTRLTEAVGRPEQRITEYTYDEYGHRLTETRRGGTVTLPDNTTVTTPDATTTFEYDVSGNLTALIDPEGFRTEYSNHDAMGNPRTKRDARQNLWTRTYDNRGMLTSDANPLGHTNRIQHDRAGLRVITIDAVNNETTYVYDPRGNVTSITDPYGGVIRYEYDAHNNRTKETDQEGKSQTTEYDLDGRVFRQVDGNGNAIQYVYGDVASGLGGTRISTVYPTFTQEYKYDNRERVVEVIDVLDAETRFTSRTVYDAAGNRTATTDKEGRNTTYAYDGLGRLSTATDPAGGVTTYAYDQRNNLIALRDPKNQTHRFEYDRRNLKAREVRPLGQAIVYTYTAIGQLDTLTDPKGQVKRYTYDNAERRIGETHHTSAASPAVKSITYTYNNLGALTGYNDGATQGTTSYDTRQLRKTGETVNYGTFSLSYGYDYYANGLKRSFTGPDGVTVTYTYDPGSQLNSIALPTGNLTINQYRWMAPAQITFPGGATRTQAYDPLMRLTNINVKDPAQNEVMSYQYGYDRADNIRQKSTEHGVYSYTYDDLYRVTEANNPTPLVGETYTYDSVGNRLIDNNVPGPWQYNSNNQLTQAGANTTFTYDANGNTVTKTDGTATTTHVWDTFDRLIEVRDGSNNLTATYAYDPFGRRLWKEVNSTRTYFFYAGEGLIAEANNAGAITTVYGYQPNSTWSTDPVYLKQGTSYFFFQNDHLGTSQKLIAQNGTIVWSGRAQAFGLTIIDTASTITNNLRFAGQYFDAEAGMHYNWNRYYDSRTGRYISWDPVGLRAGNNLYTYVSSSPANHIDPKGLIEWRGDGYGISAADVFGGGFYSFDLQSECVNGKYAYVHVFAGGLGVGGGYRASLVGGASGVVFNDGYTTIDPNVFTGTFQIFACGIGVGITANWSFIRLGQAFTSLPGITPDKGIGVDASCVAFIGRSAVWGVEMKDCCSNRLNPPKGTKCCN